jgi:hypothetical protein
MAETIVIPARRRVGSCSSLVIEMIFCWHVYAKTKMGTAWRREGRLPE